MATEAHAPDWGSKNRSSSDTIVVLPASDGPDDRRRSYRALPTGTGREAQAAHGLGMRR